MTAKRILTSHAGSLPRPHRLVELYAARSRGEVIDEAQLAAEAEAATHWVVDEQRKAGIDILSNGEQVREAFFLYVQHRVMAGTDCGFDTSAGMGRLTADVVWAKLRAMRAGADLAAKRLF